MDAWILDESPGTYRFGTIDTPEPARRRSARATSSRRRSTTWTSGSRKGMPKPHDAARAGCRRRGRDRRDRRATSTDVASATKSSSIPPCRVATARTVSRATVRTVKQFGILGEHRWGTHAEFVVVPAANVAPRPPSLDWPEAAAFGLCWFTAWRMLRRARLTAGETMLVVGVGGGVSMAGPRPRGRQRRDRDRDIARRGQAESRARARCVGRVRHQRRRGRSTPTSCSRTSAPPRGTSRSRR